jgi:pyrroloquinoline quinone (PQQ) biosynthesis protein C
VITGNAPFAQLAIEYEIERLSVQYGGQVLHLVRRRLSDESLAGMSFLVEHVALDVGHTKFNAAELEKLLGESHESASVLAAAGAAALEAYAMFLSDCSSLADSLGAQANPAVHRASPLVQKGM